MTGRREAELTHEVGGVGELGTRPVLISSLPSPHQASFQRRATMRRIHQHHRLQHLGTIESDSLRNLTTHRMANQEYARLYVITQEALQVRNMSGRSVRRRPLAAPVTPKIQRDYSSVRTKQGCKIIPPLGMRRAAVA